MKHLANRIVFVCNPVFTYGKEGWSPHDNFLSGTEESVREWASEMVRRGFDVSVYYNGEPTLHEGVDYMPYEAYIPGDVDINIKHSDFWHAAPAWYLTNEFDIARKNLENFEGVIFPSKWAADNLGYYRRFKIVPHGYDKEKIYPEKKINKQVLYCSSPDRGLHELLEMWTEIHEAHPDATLLVTYTSDDLPNLDGVMYLGQVDEDFMNDLYRTSDIWAYPCNGGELYCMSGIKAQVAGCVPCYYPTQALGETVRVGVRCNPGNFVPQIIDLLGNSRKKKWIREHLAAEVYPDWQESTRILLNAIGAIE